MNIFLSDTQRVNSPPRVWSTGGGAAFGGKCLLAVGLLYAGLDLTARAGDADLDANGNGITLDQYEQLFGLELSNPAVAILDYDQDGVLNGEEWSMRTDPCRADTDEDGWPDGIDNDISRARLDFHPLFTDGNYLRYVWPSWMVSVWKAGGEWENSLPAWTVPAGTSGRLCLKLDRSILTQDLRMELEFYDSPNALLFVDLVNHSGEVLISSELVENLIDGSGEIVRKSLTVPLESYPSAVGIHLRGTGELFVFGVLLFVEQDNDGVNATQAVPDSASPASTSVQETVVRPTESPASSGITPASGRSSHQAFQATRLKAVTIPQFVLAWMGGPNFAMTRDTLSGGGTRQTSAAFIMEDSFGQSSAIGFSYGNDITLHAGYQQAEVERLEFWNVSVTPPPYQQQQRRFNPALGETATFSYVLSTPAQAVTVNVYNQNGVWVRTLVAQEPQNGGLHTVAWDGKDEAGNFVPSNRKYTHTLSAMTYDGIVTNYQPVNTNEVRMEVADIPVIHSVFDWPDPFFPDPAVTSTISYVTAAPAGIPDLDLEIALYAGNFGGQLIRSWSMLDQPLGAHSVAWDGTDQNGVAAPDGLYAYTIREMDKANPKYQPNEKTGAILLVRVNTQTVSSADGYVEVRYTGPSTVSIEPASPAEASEALFAIQTAAPGQMLQSPIYRIETTPPTNFVPPALMAFNYNPAISGDIEEKLQIRRYNETNQVWEIVPIQFIDYANHQILAEITSFSLFALVTGEDTTAPVIQVLSPEAREYYQNAAIDILYEVEDPVMSGISSGVAGIWVYLNGELYPYSSIPPPALRLGANALTVVAYDGAGNIGRATVSFTVILEAQVTLKPEALNVNPGVLTAFVRLPDGYPVRGITSATCDGAPYERMMLSEDETEMAIKFRRQDIEAALARIGESLDIDFVVRGTWQDATGTYVFQGTDSITKIVGAR